MYLGEEEEIPTRDKQSVEEKKCRSSGEKNRIRSLRSDDRIYKNMNFAVPCRWCGLAMGHRLRTDECQSLHASVTALPRDFFWRERESLQKLCDQSGS